MRIIALFLYPVLFCAVFFVLTVETPAKVLMDYNFPDGVLWKGGHFEVYDIFQRGEKTGQAKISYSTMTMRDAPAYRLEFNQNWTDGEIEHEVKIDTKLASAGLIALMATHTQKIGDDEWRFEGNYSGDNLTVYSYYPDSPEPSKYSIIKVKSFSDADVLPFVLRNIPFEMNLTVTLNVLDVTTQSRFTPFAKVVGTEIVETSKTQYDCWVVEVNTSFTSFKAWYSRTDSHYLIKLQYPDRELVMDYHS